MAGTLLLPRKKKLLTALGLVYLGLGLPILLKAETVANVFHFELRIIYLFAFAMTLGGAAAFLMAYLRGEPYAGGIAGKQL